MKLLHTSDWHIGRTLYDKRRHDEHAAFLAWLLQVIINEQVEVLLVCGDIFDTISPGNKSQELYYSFLRRAVDSGCRHIVIIGGNHDSPSLLDAPKQVLQSLGIHVIGSCPQSVEEEIILLRDHQGEEQAIICAIPYLRDRDVRSARESTHEDKTQDLVTGLAKHYSQVQEKAKELKERIGKDIPIIVTGHLFTTGGKVAEGDGVRDLYVGSLAEVSSSLFSDDVDYVALGHLHIPQRVSKKDHIRYCGSPLAMGFGEAGQRKEVVVVDFSTDSLFPAIEPIEIPTFQLLQRITGTLETIETRLQQLVSQDQSIWVEISYDGTLSATVLREHLETIVTGSKVEILRLHNIRLADHVLHQPIWQQTLDDLDEREVFRRRLDCEELDTHEREMLIALYEKILFALHEEELE